MKLQKKFSLRWKLESHIDFAHVKSYFCFRDYMDYSLQKKKVPFTSYLWYFSFAFFNIFWLPVP